MNLSYQQIQKIISDVEIEQSIVKSHITELNKQIREQRKRLSFLNLKKKVYNEFLQNSKVDFTGCNLSDDDIDDIMFIL